MARRRKGTRGGLESVRRRLEAWRGGGRRGHRIPEDVWRDAAALARTQGVHPIARALGLNYDNLKARVNEEVSPPSSAAFVELQVRGGGESPDCVLEFQDHRGTKMTLRLPNAQALDVVALADLFLRRKR